MTSRIREILLKAAYADVIAGLGVFALTAALAVPTAGGTAFGALGGGLIAGILLSRTVAKLISAPGDRRVIETQTENDHLRAELKEKDRKIDCQSNRISELTIDLNAARQSSVTVSDFTPIFSVMLLQAQWKVWDSREFKMPNNQTYRGIRSLDLNVSLGVDFKALRIIEDDYSIRVYGFERKQMFDDLGKREWVMKEVREPNKWLAGDFTVYTNHAHLHQFAERQDRELDENLAQNGYHECERLDEGLKEACRRLIRLALKGSGKAIHFEAGAAPPSAVCLPDLLSGAPRTKKIEQTI